MTVSFLTSSGEQVCGRVEQRDPQEFLSSAVPYNKEENLVRLETAEKELEHLQYWEEVRWPSVAGREISCESRLTGKGQFQIID